LDKLVDTLKTIFDFLLITISGLIIYSIIFGGIVALGYGISYCEKFFPEQKYAFYAAYSVEYFMLFLEVVILMAYYLVHFKITLQKIWNHKG
jgi:hypothetical protein